EYCATATTLLNTYTSFAKRVIALPEQINQVSEKQIDDQEIQQISDELLAGYTTQVNSHLDLWIQTLTDFRTNFNSADSQASIKNEWKPKIKKMIKASIDKKDEYKAHQKIQDQLTKAREFYSKHKRMFGFAEAAETFGTINDIFAIAPAIKKEVSEYLPILPDDEQIKVLTEGGDDNNNKVSIREEFKCTVDKSVVTGAVETFDSLQTKLACMCAPEVNITGISASFGSLEHAKNAFGFNNNNNSNYATPQDSEVDHYFGQENYGSHVSPNPNEDGFAYALFSGWVITFFKRQYGGHKTQNVGAITLEGGLSLKPPLKYSIYEREIVVCLDDSWLAKIKFDKQFKLQFNAFKSK